MNGLPESRTKSATPCPKKAPSFASLRSKTYFFVILTTIGGVTIISLCIFSLGSFFASAENLELFTRWNNKKADSRQRTAPH